MKRFKRFLFSLLGLLLLIVATLLILVHVKTYRANSQARMIAAKIQKKNQMLYVKSQGVAKASLVFYQGALVEEEAYAPLAIGLAQKGIDVYLIDSPLNLAIFASKPTAKLKDKLPDAPVYLAGHSLGGVIAAQQAQAKTLDAKGLILLASYPAKKTDLSQTHLNVLSITASKDQVLNTKAYQTAKKRLPKTTAYHTISGGNHAGFGSYGKQAHDGKATLSAQDQQKQLVALIDHFISNQNPNTN